MSDAGERELPWDDGTTEPIWQAAFDGRLLVQRCAQCGKHQHYPRPFCLRCRSGAVEWVDSAGLGTVYSCTEVHVRATPDLAPPYTVVLVDLDESGVRMLGACPAPVVIGDRVRVAWRPRDGLPPFPDWEPVS